MSVHAGGGPAGGSETEPPGKTAGEASEGRARRDTRSLGGRFRRGLRLSLLNTVLSRAGTFLLGMLLARLLVPEQFGVYAAALVVAQLLLTVNDLGAAAALVRRPDAPVRATSDPTSARPEAGASVGLAAVHGGPDRLVAGDPRAVEAAVETGADAPRSADETSSSRDAETTGVDGVGAEAVEADAIDAVLPTAWTLSVLWGAVGAVICLVSAPWLADLLGSPAATDLIRVMAVTLLLDGFASVPAAMLTRELRQARRLVADVSGMAVNLTVTTLLALGGLGPWALVIGNVTGTVVTVVLVMGLARVWPRFGFDRAHGAEITRCGAAMLGASVLLVVVQATPQAVTGSLLGAGTLGFFYLASNMANWPAVLVSATVERVALATFSRARDAGHDLSRAVSAVLGLVCAVVLPGGVALAILAEPLIEVVYGPRWSLASAALSGLALVSVARVIAELVFSLLIAVDAMASSVLLLACWAAASIPATIWAAQVWGLAGVAWAQASAALLVALPIHLLALRRARVSLRTVVGGAAVPLFSALGCGAVLTGLRGLGLPVLIEILLGGLVVGAVVTGGVLRAQHRVTAALGTTGTTAAETPAWDGSVRDGSSPDGSVPGGSARGDAARDGSGIGGSAIPADVTPAGVTPADAVPPAEVPPGVVQQVRSAAGAARPEAASGDATR
ncbi:PST family polysaccharide transporter [Actinoalloteichus hoggarensis]|uniref:Teichuronic acid biosynthesis protein TuaB n=1 Tax=Actinoalloteichus hoggarensis TaxID=1470176 RepID=A0A221WA82_9PSEU|nr:Teichuronic acid biosynthesis protein TuaB [Actinoalloteichus hoggarensis]MBB5922516.1 PST family polysaccharide transporter [Actinoalloteichus hoggarensis]